MLFIFRNKSCMSYMMEICEQLLKVIFKNNWLPFMDTVYVDSCVVDCLFKKNFIF